MINLRYYQEEAVNSLFDYFHVQKGNPLISMATGTGKSFTMCAFMERAINQFSDTKFI